jgi:hypothetical protein
LTVHDSHEGLVFTSGSVTPLSVNRPMSAGMPYSSLKVIRHDAAPAPPEMINVPSMSKRTATCCNATDGLWSVGSSSGELIGRLLVMATEAHADTGGHLVGQAVEIS